MADAVNDGGNGRNSDGTFARGNRLGKGNPDLVRVAAFRRQIQKAISPEIIGAIFRKLTLLVADEGNVEAARLLLSYLLGRPRQEPSTALFELPALKDARSVAEAACQLAEAAAAGELDSEAAARLGGLLEVARRSYELSELEARVQALEGARVEGRF